MPWVPGRRVCVAGAIIPCILSVWIAMPIVMTTTVALAAAGVPAAGAVASPMLTGVGG